MIYMMRLAGQDPHFIVGGDEPYRVETSSRSVCDPTQKYVNDYTIAHVYEGHAIDVRQIPVGAFDSAYPTSDLWVSLTSVEVERYRANPELFLSRLDSCLVGLESHHKQQLVRGLGCRYDDDTSRYIVSLPAGELIDEPEVV